MIRLIKFVKEVEWFMYQEHKDDLTLDEIVEILNKEVKKHNFF